MKLLEEYEEIVLMRGGEPVRSLFGSFGSSLRETRLTAMLGFLIAKYPRPWEKFFEIGRPVSTVTVEANQERGRADIWLETVSQTIVVEAKVFNVDPSEQAKRYKADREILISNHAPISERESRRSRYINWDQIASFLRNSVMKGATKPEVKYLAKEVINYMAENGLSRSSPQTEIYAREINNEITLDLFLKGRLYGCDYEKGSKAAQALYFSPHFGKKLASERPSIFPGISFIARIDAVEVIDTWKSLLLAVRKHRGGQWLNQNIDVVRPIRNEWEWDGHQRTFLFLSPPRLVFNPPVNKELLQEGKGWLSKRTFTFDELFQAWGKSGSAKIKG